MVIELCSIYIAGIVDGYNLKFGCVPASLHSEISLCREARERYKTQGHDTLGLCTEIVTLASYYNSSTRICA